MKFEEVKTKEQARRWLLLPLEIYKNDPNWIRPLDKDIEAVFDPEKNKFIKRGGEYSRWLLTDDAGKDIGRIAIFINKQYRQEQPTGGIGFFECSNNQDAADALFDLAHRWLADRGMEAMDGPINFGERDRWWGLLVDGFHPPLYCMNYNPPYYQRLFENYGFKVYFNQICFAMPVQVELQEKFYDRHAALAKDPGYRAEMIDKGNLQQYVKDFTYIYNKAWAGHGGGKQLEEKTVAAMFQSMKLVIDEHITWFIYYKDEPIAVWLNLPDLNQWFGKFNGRLGLLQKLWFLWLKKFGKCNRFVGIVFGVIPEFQGKGVDAYLIVEAAKEIQKRGRYQRFEMQWIGDFNPKMINISESLGTTRNRTLSTYRYLFDANKEFKRHPILG